MKLLRDCEYTAFISYAHADDVAWYNWVTQFRNELERSLGALLRGVRLPRMHLSGEDGPVSGALSDELKTRVAQSFAMVIVVHDNYAQSDWCLKELEYFKSLFGDEGMRQRLYIVATSEPAMQAVAGSPAWQQLLPGADQLWTPFFDPSERGKPLDIYLAPGLVSPDFRRPFERLRGDFAAKLRAAAGAAGDRERVVHLATAGVPAAPSASVAMPDILLPPLGKPPLPAAHDPGPALPPALPPTGPSSPAPRRGVRLYIESNRHERTLWEPLGEQIRTRWERLCRQLAPDEVPPLSLRTRGLPVEDIDRYPNLDDADGVVLLWGRKTSEALVAQINKVENKLAPGRDCPPGIVAYLMPPQLATEPIPAWGWQVLRFNALVEGQIDVVAEEDDDLDRFLQKVFFRLRQRSSGGL